MGDEEFQTGSGNWSQLSRSSRSSSSPPPPSSTYAWPIQVADVMKQPHKQPLQQDHPNLQYMIGLGLASQPVEWNQPSLFSTRGSIEKSDENSSFRSILQEDHDHSSSSTTSFQQAEQQWPPLSSQKMMMYSTSSAPPPAPADVEGIFSSLNPSQFLSSRQHHLNPNNINNHSGGTTGGFQMYTSSSIQYQNNPTTTSLLPGLLGYEMNHQPSQQHSTPSMTNFISSYTTSYGMHSSSSSDHDHQQLMLQPNSWQASNNKPQDQLHLSNNAPFWNASPVAPIINHDVRSNLFPSLQMQSPSSNFDEKPKKSSSSSETSNKRPRNDTPSPLPAKAKKEKMGDRITALQQLVSPFGKTDTASVLSEVIEYIKFLHEQVNVLSNAYMKSGAPIQQQSNDQEGQQQDLKSRGLCLVPVSSTFAITHETTVDFWNPTFGGSFR